jgi:hypothetical protein
MTSAMQVITLVRHASTPCHAVRRIEVSALRLSADTLALCYSVDADLARLRLPPRTEPRRADELWRHTCLEAFIRQNGSPAYCEFNFAPSMAWAAYRFTGYREGMAPLDHSWMPQTSLRPLDSGLELHAVIRLGDIESLRGAARLLLAASAVIEESDGRISYWSIRHPAGKPDFHHHDSFALEI